MPQTSLIQPLISLRPPPLHRTSLLRVPSSTQRSTYNHRHSTRITLSPRTIQIPESHRLRTKQNPLEIIRIPLTDQKIKHPGNNQIIHSWVFLQKKGNNCQRQTNINQRHPQWPPNVRKSKRFLPPIITTIFPKSPHESQRRTNRLGVQAPLLIHSICSKP